MSGTLNREYSSYQQIKATGEASDNHAAQEEERMRAAIILFLDFLQSNNYAASVAQIEKETNISLENYSVCDNIDIINIIAEFEEFYKFKYGKPAKLIKRITREQKESRDRKQPSRPRTPNILDKIVQKNLGINTADPALERAAEESCAFPEVKKPPEIMQNTDKNENETTEDTKAVLGISGVPISADQAKQLSQPLEPPKMPVFRPVLKAPPADFPAELLSFYYIIENEIITEHPADDFGTIIGLRQAKETLTEAVIFPEKYPELFEGILSPWRGCLLFSAPGNGKSHLARSLACECGCAFFNVSAASLLSKYYGESEKLVRCLFLAARQYERSVIFIDELDCMMTSRAEGNEHEASKRLKTELLVEIDGLSSQNQQIFVLAATNLPWTIDSAMLRRLEKRVYVHNLDFEGRADLIRLKIGDRIAKKFKGEVVDYLAKHTENWSGSDICCLCKECAMIKLRRGIARLEQGDTAAVDLTVGIDEARDAAEAVRPSYDLGIQNKYDEWDKEFGSV